MSTPDPARGYSEYASPTPGTAGYGYGDSPQQPEISPKTLLPALLLCFFLGWIGAHRFYVGKVGTGILMLITFGGFGIWSLIDFIMIAIGKFTDKQGLALAR